MNSSQKRDFRLMYLKLKASGIEPGPDGRYDDAAAFWAMIELDWKKTLRFSPEERDLCRAFFNLGFSAARGLERARNERA